MWDDYLIFLVAPLVFTRLLLYDLTSYQITIWLIDDVMLFLLFVCSFDNLILGFYYSNLTRETSGLELASIINLVLQASRLSKCSGILSHLFQWYSVFSPTIYYSDSILQYFL